LAAFAILFAGRKIVTSGNICSPSSGPKNKKNLLGSNF
jgi:hypothetical protein